MMNERQDKRFEPRLPFRDDTQYRNRKHRRHFELERNPFTNPFPIRTQMMDSVWVNWEKYTHTYDANGNMTEEFWQIDAFILLDILLDITDDNPLPKQFVLSQNYPNPFNPVTTINYDLPEQSQVTLKIYDILGREIRKLVNTTQDAGNKSVIWDGTDEFGRPVGRGIYLYQIKANDFTQTRKMLLLR